MARQALFVSVAAVILSAGGPLAAQPTAAALGAGASRAAAFPEACAGGLVPDDGSAETGYGWIPSVIDGRYVQEVDAAQLPFRELRKLCVCWLRTRSDDEIDFEVVFHARQGDQPAPQPYAAVPARATGVPLGVTGRFYEVDVSGVELAPGISYVGVRWNPSIDRFFFVCTDTSPATPPVEAFYIDFLASDWTSVFESRDPIFANHRAMMLRLQARPATVLDVPAMGGAGAFLLALFLAAAAVRAVRRR